MIQIIPNWICQWAYDDTSEFKVIISARTCQEAMQLCSHIMHGAKTIFSFSCYKQEP